MSGTSMTLHSPKRKTTSLKLLVQWTWGIQVSSGKFQINASCSGFCTSNINPVHPDIVSLCVINFISSVHPVFKPMTGSQCCHHKNELHFLIVPGNAVIAINSHPWNETNLLRRHATILLNWIHSKEKHPKRNRVATGLPHLLWPCAQHSQE